ncbi:MAG: LysR family transcriptional regulator [Bradyrhizobium sp.]|nr:LysR family transcriptional regulator [Pseudomonadota bacterium]MDE2068176.1 LysR family transcriptional regulator [Bradyrhizobium sp.]MDE2243021.1 LysR family transcriptional regulator [Bradyrhizobium sp.]MDE2472903.1 LysR family transcriptional regulator [Bradyrhizobium sp.]
MNIPIEIVRTVVAISETGSLSKAGERLGLSQPAISSQIKRLQSLVGGALFLKTANGTTTTELGKLALQQARRILEANDQLLRLGGNTDGIRPLRLGLSTLLVEQFIQQQTDTLTDIFIHTDHSVPIGKGLIDGYIDIACIFENAAIEGEIEQLVINRVKDPLVWVRARNFVLSPGAPVPILTWPDDDWMMRTLTRYGIAYNIVFSSPDHHAKLAAVKAGIGFTAMPASMVPPSLVRAREYYLPELPPIETLLCARRRLQSERASALLKQLSAMFFDRPDAGPGSTVQSCG